MSILWSHRREDGLNHRVLESGWRSCSLKKISPYQNFWPPNRTSDFRLEVLSLCGNQNFWPPIRTSDVRLEVLALRGNQNFGPPVRTSDVHLEVLALRENQNFWPPVRTSNFRSPNQGESKLDPNSSKLVGTWRLSLGEVSYWDKTTPSIYIRG